jgi:sterol 14-demethylase
MQALPMLQVAAPQTSEALLEMNAHHTLRAASESMSFMNVAYAVLAIVAAVVVYVQYLKFILWFKYRNQKLPPVYPGLPVLGSVLDFIKHPLHFITDVHKELRDKALKIEGSQSNNKGECFTLSIVGQRLTFLVDNDATETFFKHADHIFDQNEPYQFCVPIFGRGVIYDAPLSIRKAQIKFVTDSLHQNVLARYIPKMVKETEVFFQSKLTGSSSEFAEFDLKDALSELIILTASSCLMGREVREQMFDQVSKLYDTLDKGLLPVSVFLPNLPIPPHLARNKARQQMCDLFSKIIRARRAAEEAAISRNEKPEEYDDVLHVFMNGKYPDGTLCTDEHVTGLMIALLFAGQHTSSVTSTWTGMLCMNDPEIWGRLIEEQRTCIHRYGNTITHEALDGMRLLHNAIKEALRMFPPLILLMRKAQMDVNFKGVTIPKGDTVVVSPALAHMLEHVFPNPKKFDPDRWDYDKNPGNQQ